MDELGSGRAMHDVQDAQGTSRRPTTERLSHWLSIAGNVAVLAGLLFLAIEVRQNTEAVVSASSTALTDQSLQFFAAGLDNQIVARALHKQRDGEPLDGLETEQLIRLQYLNFRVFEHAYLQYVRGYYNAEEWDRYRGIIRRNLIGDSIARVMWERNTGTGFTTSFEQEVNRLLATP